MPHHIQEVIKLEGGNEYREGREDGVVRPYNSESRHLNYERQLAGRRFTDSDREDADEDDSDADKEKSPSSDQEDKGDDQEDMEHHSTHHLNRENLAATNMASLEHDENDSQTIVLAPNSSRRTPTLFPTSPPSIPAPSEPPSLQKPFKKKISRRALGTDTVEAERVANEKSNAISGVRMTRGRANNAPSITHLSL